MKAHTPIAVMLSACLMLPGCANGSGMSENQGRGAAFGCLLGLAVGLAVMKDKGAGAALGCAAGGVAGVAIGSILDERERRQMAEASARAGNASKGQKINWGDSFEAVPARGTSSSSPSQTDKSASGWVVPTTDTFVAADGKECRQLQRHADKAGKTYDDTVRVCKVNQTWALSS